MAARICLELALQMVLKGEEPIMGFDSESEVSDEEDPIEDPDYCPPGVVRPSTSIAGSQRNQPSPPDEQYQLDTVESSDEASEEEEEMEEEERPILSNRMSRKGSKPNKNHHL